VIFRTERDLGVQLTMSIAEYEEMGLKVNETKQTLLPLSLSPASSRFTTVSFA